jgi:hypothetical protein
LIPTFLPWVIMVILVTIWMWLVGIYGRKCGEGKVYRNQGFAYVMWVGICLIIGRIVLWSAGLPLWVSDHTLINAASVPGELIIALLAVSILCAVFAAWRLRIRMTTEGMVVLLVMASFLWLAPIGTIYVGSTVVLVLGLCSLIPYVLV